MMALVEVPAGITPTEASIAAFIVGFAIATAIFKWREVRYWIIETSKDINKGGRYE